MYYNVHNSASRSAYLRLRYKRIRSLDMKPQEESPGDRRRPARKGNRMNIEDGYDIKYFKRQIEENKALADELGLSFQELLALRTFLAVDSIDDKLDDLSVTTYEAYKG